MNSDKELLHQQNYKLMTELATSEATSVMMLDPHGIILGWDHASESLYGYSANQIVGQSFILLFPADVVQREEPANFLKFAAEQGKFETDHFGLNRNGELLPVHTVTASLRDSDNRILGFTHMTRHLQAMSVPSMITELASDSFKGAFHQAPIGMMLVDLDWQVLRVNRSICEMLGYTDEELITKSFQDITHPDDISTDLDLVRQMIAGDINDYRLEKRYMHKDGHVIWMLLSVSLLKDENKIPQHFIFHIQDITEYKRIQKQISEYAYQDALTNLPNRRLLQDRLKLAVKHAKRYKRRLGLMFLDIDYFKSINDTYGHAFGDELIKAVAQRLSESVRSADTVCRLGGDEFVVVVTEVNQREDITVIAEKILANASRPVRIDHIEVSVTLSVGVVMFDAGAGDDADSLMKKADQALYEMKREGRNGYRVYHANQARNPTSENAS